MDRAGATSRATTVALISLALAGVSLAASTLHLGRPAFAWRALRGVKTSWLSREVLLLALFAGIASAYAGLLLIGNVHHTLAGMLTALAGLAGVFCSARIYIVLARPAWNSGLTIADFFCHRLRTRPAASAALRLQHKSRTRERCHRGAVAQLVVQGSKLAWLSFSNVFELKASAQLQVHRFRDIAHHPLCAAHCWRHPTAFYFLRRMVCYRRSHTRPCQ